MSDADQQAFFPLCATMTPVVKAAMFLDVSLHKVTTFLHMV